MKVFQKDYQRAMADVNRYISMMNGRKDWGQEITVNRKDYDLLIKNGHAKEISRGVARYRQEYTLVVG